MHIISRKALREFSQRHPDSKTALNTWFRILSTNHFESFNALRQVFAGADKVGNLIEFNIGLLPRSILIGKRYISGIS
jgi:mRNA interferase HigB